MTDSHISTSPALQQRFTGALKVWKADKGYGFLTPDDNAPDIFIHISAFQKADIKQPAVGMRVDYREGEGRNGRVQAIDVRLA